MGLQVTTIMLGVEDLARSRRFYAEGFHCAIDQDHPNFVLVNLGDDSSSLALYEREAAAQDAGVAAAGSGFRGLSLHYIVASKEEVDRTIAEAVAAGGNEVKAAAAAKWGGYFGYFGDPDGYLWKVATNQ